MSSRARLGLLLALSLGFVCLGLVVAALGDWRLGFGNVGFFGMAAVVFAYQLREFDKLDGAPQLLTLRGGVPMYLSQKRRALFIVVVFGAGGSSMLIGYERNPLLWWLGLGLVVTAVVVGVLTALGVLGRQAIMFSPQGIHFLGGVPCVLAFDNLAQLRCVEWNGHLIVLLIPINLAGLVMTVPEAKRDGAGKKFGQSLAFMGAPLTIWSSQFGLEANSLMKTIERYVREPASRAELATK